MQQKNKYKKIEPASGAIIMAGGIFLIGTVQAFPVLDIQFGKFLAFLVLIAWIIIYKSLSVQFFHRDFLIPFIKHPVNSFAIGTWIAGVSVLCNVFVKYFPTIILITQAMAILNTFLWLFFLFTCFYNFRRLFFENQNYPVHGVILLSTVGTQSIILLLNNVFFQFPTYFSEAIIVLGFMFYLAGIILIGNRYVRQHNWTLINDWSNTNCIIHGALSITGLAIVTTNTFTPAFITVFWVIVFLLLIVIEAIEVVRAIKRIKNYGWNIGLFQYNVSQWSRNFTFGMFYTFSLVMHLNPYYPIPEKLYNFQHAFMIFWAWVVLSALIIQIGIYIKSQIETHTRTKEGNISHTSAS
ncbi:hypothetical protein CFK37_01165 [Virgibacillus phasianinus]|uniref:Uncharacterized protein n=1 Tax=Virgibacillus phasianinus TaxID=2017483 RepID=A0A220TYN5_9BACI|nr:hypothetical protein [Virgibacillus phasianinus]ASK60917.1 hypothetical protein CFK37_01165 [Virgibacillus phasianinus]